MDGMSQRLRFDDQVVVVTGAGQGVGRAYALELARRGAKVVVNDLGVKPDGDGSDEGPAARVVAEIRAAGGEAVASTDSVATREGGEAIVAAGMEAWGRIDGLIHNAGILRDASFAKLEVADLDKVMSVHLMGAIYVGQPAFRAMRDAGRGGRILLTSSSSGLFGNFGQSSYAIAKMGLVGLVRVLAIEGSKYDIKVNAVAPTAGTRLTGGKDSIDDSPLAPGKLAATGVVLMHPDCPSTGEIFQSGGGWVARVALQIAGGHMSNGPEAAEDLLAHWDAVRGGDWTEPKTAHELGALLQLKLGLDKLSY
jgi:NAD(P)-dependent dehydrogenase (short-subunit alcohol dehydrogenase family)